MTESPVIVALDFPHQDEILGCANLLDPELCKLKIGFEAFVTAGPGLVETLQNKGFDIFLDLKFHDIPNTVAAACHAAANLGVWMINIHASGGRRMMEAAREAVDRNPRPPLLIAVTVLTSMSQEDLSATGMDTGPAEQVAVLADLAHQSGMDGVVCSAQEAAALRQAHDDGFVLVTPGIRPAGSETADQRRIMTPLEAVTAGSDYLVIGRPVTQSSHPRQVLNEILVTLS